MAEPTIASFLGGQLRNGAASLVAATAKMPGDKLEWAPKIGEHGGRSPLDQLKECAYVNEWCAKALATSSNPGYDGDDYVARTGRSMSYEDVAAWVTGSSEALAAAIESTPLATLNTTLEHPWTHKTVTWAEFMQMAAWNMAYHEGQINYVQLMYGDTSH